MLITSITMLCALALVRGETCSPTERENIVTTWEKEEDLDSLSRSTQPWRRMVVPRMVDAYLIESITYARYCAPRALYASCEIGDYSNKYTDSEVVELAKKRSCAGPPRCQGGNCAFPDKRDCFDAPKTVWYREGVEGLTSAGSKWWYYFCLRWTTCEYKEVKAYISLLSTDHARISVTENDHCTIKIGKTTSCYLGTIDKTLHVPDGIEAVEKEISVPCIRGKDSTTCMDLDLKSPFIANERGIALERNIAYIKIPREDKEFLGTYQIVDGSASLEDVKENSEYLMYNNLQSIYNNNMARKEINNLRKLVKSLIYYNYNLTFDPLHMARGSAGEVKLWNSTHLLLTPCVVASDFYPPQRSISPSNTTVTRLFPGESFDDIEVGMPDFKIYKMTSEELKAIGRKSRRLDDSAISGTETWYGGLWGSIASFFSSYSVLVSWSGLILSMHNVNALMRRP